MIIMENHFTFGRKKPSVIKLNLSVLFNAICAQLLNSFNKFEGNFFTPLLSSYLQRALHMYEEL